MIITSLDYRKVFVLSFFVFVISCSSEEDNDCGNPTITYDNTIENIIETSCNNGGCHVGPNGGWGVLADFSSYNDLLPLLTDGSIGFRINLEDNRSMPPPSNEDRTISDSDLNLLNDWLCNGYPEN